MNMMDKNQLPIDILALAKGDKKIARLIAQKIAATSPGAVNFLCSMLTHEFLSKFITDNDAMKVLKQKVMRLSSLDISDPVLIKGETGVGKELIAHALHGDRTGNFVGINCTSLPSELLESELFGHVKGAFTGAWCDKTGKFEYANNGTLFLDEIGDMPYDMQVKLLRVLQERVICRLGSNEDVPINVRIVAATNNMSVGEPGFTKFRQDLYYRLNTFELVVSPLRERPEDIVAIIEELDTEHKLTTGQITEIKMLPLRGNVRELQALLRRYYILNELEYKL